MTRRRNILFLLAFLGAAVGLRAASAQEPRGRPQTPSAPTFERFRIVVERNIFNADRRRAQPITTRTVAQDRRQPDEQIALLGTLINRNTTATEIVAFFGGSRPEYDKMARLGDGIAGLRVTEVRTDIVKMEKDGRMIVLPVGYSLSRPDEREEWQVVAGSGSSSRPGEGARSRDERSATAKTVETSVESSQGDASSGDVLKALIERRKKEMEQ